MYKKAWCTCRVVVLLIKPIVFLPSRCRRRLGFVRSLLWSQRPKRFLGFTKPVSGSSIVDYSALPFNKISQVEDCCSRKVTHSLRNIAWWTTAAIGVYNICLAPFSRQTNPNRTNLANYDRQIKWEQPFGVCVSPSQTASDHGIEKFREELPDWP